MHFAALFMIHFHPRSRLLSILGCSINFRIDGARELAAAAAVTRHREIYGPRISRTSPRAMTIAIAEKSVYPARCVKRTGYLKASGSRAICTGAAGIRTRTPRGAIRIPREITAIKLYGIPDSAVGVSLFRPIGGNLKLIAECGTARVSPIVINTMNRSVPEIWLAPSFARPVTANRCTDGMESVDSEWSKERTHM